MLDALFSYATIIAMYGLPSGTISYSLWQYLHERNCPAVRLVLAAAYLIVYGGLEYLYLAGDVRTQGAAGLAMLVWSIATCLIVASLALPRSSRRSY